MRIPNEFGEAVIGYESVMHGFSQQELENESLVLKWRRSGEMHSRGSYQSCMAFGLTS